MRPERALSRQLQEIDRLAREEPLDEDSARKFYARIVAIAWGDESEEQQAARLDKLMEDRRERLDREAGQ
jgi:hypothetical protein